MFVDVAEFTFDLDCDFTGMLLCSFQERGGTVFPEVAEQIDQVQVTGAFFKFSCDAFVPKFNFMLL